mgnify:CR=1 FL=1
MQGFLATHEITVKETSNATKERIGASEALKLAKAASRVVAGRGKKVVSFDMKNDPPDDETLLKHLLGPSGNLRAPTLRRGKTLLVGFHEDEFTSILT